VSLELIVASEVGRKTGVVLAAVAGAGVGSLGGGPLGTVGGLAVAGFKAYVDQTKKLTQEMLLDGGRKFSAVAVIIGDPRHGARRRPLPVGYVSEARFPGEGEERFRLRREPREQLLDYRPGMHSAWQIPGMIDLVSVSLTWNDILKEASKLNEVGAFCASFRRELQRSLQYDRLAVRLGLYAHFSINRHQFDGDRTNRGCLDPAELRALNGSGYVF
jgi:hypothetical protein